MEGKKYEITHRGPGFFFFFFRFPLFETTEIYLECTKMENFYREKEYLMPGKNQEK